MAIFTSTFHWLQRKRYQYEVTFSLYMLTPTEKFIFNSFLFLFFSMVIIAMTLYLPQHVSLLANRALFYYQGDAQTKSAVPPASAMHSQDPHTPTANIIEAVTETLVQTLASMATATGDINHAEI